MKILELFVAHELFRGFGSRICFLLRCFRSFDLRFDALAFPAACHAYSVTQIAQIAGESEEKRFNAEDSERRRGERGDVLQKVCDSLSLAEVGDFFVEVSEGGFEGLAMVGVSGGSEVVGDADAR